MRRARLMPLSSVRARLALWNVVVLALVLGMLGALLRTSLKANRETVIDRDLVRQSERSIQRWKDISAAMRRASANKRPGAAQVPSPPPPPPIATTPGGRRDGFRPPFFGRDGKQVVSGATDRLADRAALDRGYETGWAGYSTVTTTNALLLPPDSRPEKGDVAPPTRLRVYTTPVVGEGGKIETVFQSSRSLEPVYDEVGRLTNTLLALVPLALLISAAGAVFLTDRAIRPVRAVTRAAAEIGAREDLSARLPTAGGDEFARLSATFNAMLGRLEQAFARQEEAYERQRRFVGDASHELRTPLTVIKANTSLALSDDGLPAEYREVLTAVDTAADRTIRIVQDLLLLARSDAGQLPIRPEPLDVSDLLMQAQREALALQPEGAPITVEVEPAGVGDDAPLTVVADRHHLPRLLSNLLDNALRYTPADGHITLSARPADGRRVEIAVSDDGEGIPQEHLPHITERFYRVDASRERSHGGTGLGLAICRAIACAHGGALSLTSEVGHGTTVRVLLPRA
jgi:signal transduction histidine kinase